MKKIWAILLILIASACEEPVDWPQETAVIPRLVVEAMITNNPDINYVRLTLPVSDPNEKPLRVIGAQVAILDSDHYWLFSPDSLTPGLYRPQQNFRAVINKAYGLYISIGEYDFFGTSYLIPVRPMDPLAYYELQGQPGYYSVYKASEPDASMIEYRIEWESSPGQNEVKVLYSYTLHTVDVNQFFKPDAENIKFPAGARVIRTKYSLNSDYERYLRSLLSETEWNGGWFDVLPGNLHTNMSTGAVGYFAACSVVRDTTWIAK